MAHKGWDPDGDMSYSSPYCARLIPHRTPLPRSLTILDTFPRGSPLCGPREHCGRDPARVDVPTALVAHHQLSSSMSPLIPRRQMAAKECHRPERVRLPDLTHLYPLLQAHGHQAVDVTACLPGHQEEVKKGTNGLRGQSPAGEESGRGAECKH